MDEVTAYDHAPADLRDTDDLLNSLETAVKAKEKHLAELVARR